MPPSPRHRLFTPNYSHLTLHSLTPSPLLSRRECAALRGLAIGLIVLHNFCHWLPRCVDENEYTWALSRIELLTAYLRDGGPHVLLNLLSHYGHYGVALFLFLSGYGLVRKYEGDAPAPSPLRFIGHQAVKLWKLMLPALLILWLLKTFYAGGWTWQARHVWELLLFVVNLDVHRPLILGPWWWFSLMMQFYLLYRLVIHGRGRRVLIATTVLCLALQAWATVQSWGHLANSSCIMTYWHYNLPCSILPFALGVWAARYGAAWLLSPWSAAVGALVVVGGSYSPWLWSVAGPFAVALMLQGRRLPLQWLGGISAWVFALHPIVREYTIGTARAGHPYMALAAYLLITLTAAWLMTFILRKAHDIRTAR